MANFNKVMLMGNLTRDPQLSYTPSQTAVVEFGMAINRTWKGQDGQKKEETCFVDCQAYGRTAENLNKYMSKGRPLFVEGRLNFSSWTAQDGTKRSKLRVMVEKFEFINSGQGGQGGGQGGGDAGGNRSDASPTGSQAEPGTQAESNSAPSDDIPF
ncbi:single-stranded DNA-binding protein [Planctomycetota bacterium]